MECKDEWKHIDQYISPYGSVTLEGGEWVGRVNMEVGGMRRVGRLKETYLSASVAMACVEERWKRERGQ